MTEERDHRIGSLIAAWLAVVLVYVAIFLS